LLAVDWGEVRIGLALSDETQTLATPLETLVRRRGKRFPMSRFLELVAQHVPTGVVVGLPLASDNPEEEGSQARWVRRYAGRLAGALSVPVAFWDESYSSAEADRLVGEGGGRTPRDAAAAAVILQEFLEARRAAGRGNQAILGTSE